MQLRLFGARVLEHEPLVRRRSARLPGGRVTADPRGIPPKYFSISERGRGNEVAADRDHRVVRDVVGKARRPHVGRTHRRRRGIRREMIGMPRGKERAAGQLVVRAKRDVVDVLASLLLDDATHGRDPLRIRKRQRCGHAIRLGPQHRLELVARHRDVVLGHVLPGLGEVRRRSAERAIEVPLRLIEMRRALRNQMLAEMDDAGPVGVVVLRSDMVPDLNADDRRRVILVENRNESVRQRESRVGRGRSGGRSSGPSRALTNEPSSTATPMRRSLEFSIRNLGTIALRRSYIQDTENPPSPTPLRSHALTIHTSIYWGALGRSRCGAGRRPADRVRPRQGRRPRPRRSTAPTSTRPARRAPTSTPSPTAGGSSAPRFPRSTANGARSTSCRTRTRRSCVRSSRPRRADVKAGKAKAPSNQFKIGAFYARAWTPRRSRRSARSRSMHRWRGLPRSSRRPTCRLPSTAREVGRSAPFGVGAGPDLKNSDRIIANAGQGGLSLPEKNYYISQDTSMQGIRDKFERHVAADVQARWRERRRCGAAHAKTVLEIETKFAAASMDRVHDAESGRHLPRDDGRAVRFIAPRMKWEAFLTTMGAPAISSEINVAQPDFFKAMDGFLDLDSVDDWKTLLRWRLLSASARVCRSVSPTRTSRSARSSRRRRSACRDGRRASATPTACSARRSARNTWRARSRPRPRRAPRRSSTTWSSVLHDQIGQLDWMSDATKQQALVKLDAFTRKIGYPDKWRDYSKLEVDAGAYYGNVRRGERVVGGAATGPRSASRWTAPSGA